MDHHSTQSRKAPVDGLWDFTYGRRTCRPREAKPKEEQERSERSLCSGNEVGSVRTASAAMQSTDGGEETGDWRRPCAAENKQVGEVESSGTCGQRAALHSTRVPGKPPPPSPETATCASHGHGREADTSSGHVCPLSGWQGCELGARAPWGLCAEQSGVSLQAAVTARPAALLLVGAQGMTTPGCEAHSSQRGEGRKSSLTPGHGMPLSPGKY